MHACTAAKRVRGMQAFRRVQCVALGLRHRNAHGHLLALPRLPQALFGAGAVLLRGAGCTVNDLWDRNLDKQVGSGRGGGNLMLRRVPRQLLECQVNVAVTSRNQQQLVTNGLCTKGVCTLPPRRWSARAAGRWRQAQSRPRRLWVRQLLGVGDAAHV